MIASSRSFSFSPLPLPVYLPTMRAGLRLSLLLVIPLLLSLIPIALPLSSPSPQPSTPAPADIDLTSLMSKNGCKAFADLLRSTGDAADSFASNIASGLTAFCPTDPAMKPFLPRFKNLTADGKVSLLLYHAIPIYYTIRMLESSNGVMNTLATDGINRNYNFTVQNDGDDVTLKTRITTAKITGTIIDSNPVALYTINAVLEPGELFKPPPAPAPAPEAVSDSPKTSGKKPKHEHESPPASSPGEAAADQKVADNSSAVTAELAFGGVGLAAALFFLLTFV